MNSVDKLLSIIVPVYKAEKHLDRCVESILSQTYGNIELVLVDDGSPDACPAMCDSWAKRDWRVRVIHKKNNGAAFARNAGPDMASGEYLSFVDADFFVELRYVRNFDEKRARKQRRSLWLRLFPILPDRMKFRLMAK